MGRGRDASPFVAIGPLRRRRSATPRTRSRCTRRDSSDRLWARARRLLALRLALDAARRCPIRGGPAAGDEAVLAAGRAGGAAAGEALARPRQVAVLHGVVEGARGARDILAVPARLVTVARIGHDLPGRGERLGVTGPVRSTPTTPHGDRRQDSEHDQRARDENTMHAELPSLARPGRGRGSGGRTQGACLRKSQCRRRGGAPRSSPR